MEPNLLDFDADSFPSLARDAIGEGRAFRFVVRGAAAKELLPLVRDGKVTDWSRLLRAPKLHRLAGTISIANTYDCQTRISVADGEVIVDVGPRSAESYPDENPRPPPDETGSPRRELPQVEPAIHSAWQRISTHFPRAEKGPPATPEVLDRVRSILGDAAPDLLRFYLVCNGIDMRLRDEVVGRIFRAEESLAAYPIGGRHRRGPPALRRLWPIRADGCGNYDCYVLGGGQASGCIVFWDHEGLASPAFLVASSLASYLEMWAECETTRCAPDGAVTPDYMPRRIDRSPWVQYNRRHPWPHDRQWLIHRDPDVARLLNGRALPELLDHED